jgi:hypothetical protein
VGRRRGSMGVREMKEQVDMSDLRRLRRCYEMLLKLFWAGMLTRKELSVKEAQIKDALRELGIRKVALVLYYWKISAEQAEG